MNTPSGRSLSPAPIWALVAVIACALVSFVAQAGPARAVGAYLTLMFGPGLALGALFARRRDALELTVWSTLISPVVSAGLAAVLLAAAVSPDTAARILVVAMACLTVGALRRRGRWECPVSRSQGWVLAGFIAALVLLCSFLPMTQEWWRVRSDAMFHRAVVNEMADFGVPPMDPYFDGFRLQYMWFYHALMLVISRASGMAPQWAMAFFNMQALVGLIVSAYLLSGVFKQSFWYRMSAAVMVPLGLNSLFWLFLPIKMGRALTGEVRGWSEITRQLSLSPLSYEQTYRFMHIWGNAEFFLDKYIVATAFSLGLSLMVAAWYAASDMLRSRSLASGALLLLSVAGMFGFHTLVGAISLAGIVGGAGLLWFSSRSTNGFSFRSALAVALCCAGGVVLVFPYLRVLTSGRDSSAAAINLSFNRVAGVLIAVALALLLAAFQKKFWRSRVPSERFLAMSIICVFSVCALINISEANAQDKLGYFCFLPLAIPASWSLVDFVSSRRAHRAGWAIAVSLLFFLPANALGFIGVYFTPIPVEITRAEYQLAHWVRENTGREDVFIDHDDEVSLLVTGPRRYFYGRHSYARYWSYDRVAMSRRYHARAQLYSREPLDATTLEALADEPHELYAVLREDVDAGTNLATRGDLFHKVYEGSGLALYRVDRDACRNASEGLPRVSDDALLRESGL